MKVITISWKRRAVMFAAAAVMIISAGKLTVKAAQTDINITQDSVTLNLGGTSVVNVDYSGLAGGFAELAVVSADNAIVSASLYDLGNNKANLAMVSTGTGSTTVAVYSASNPTVVDYVAVQSGLAGNSQVMTTVNGTTLTTVFLNRVITYDAVLKGKNEATLAVSGLVIERESGVDRLKVTGAVLTTDSKTPGMSTYYANFYDAAGRLMKRQAVYLRDPLENAQLELFWYIPEGCVSISLE